MTLNLIRGLLLWGAVLMLALALSIPLSQTVRLTVLGLIAIGLLLAWSYLGRRAARQALPLKLAAGACLPGVEFRAPVVLVCGDGLAGLFGAVPDGLLAIRCVAQGCYLRVTQLEQLPTMVAAVLAQRPTWGAQLSVLWIVNPSEESDSAVLTARVRTFCYQLGLARQGGNPLPFMVASYLQGGSGAGPWFCRETGQLSPMVHEAGQCMSPLEWHRQGAQWPVERAQTKVRLDSLLAWQCANVQPHCGEQGRRPIGLPLAWSVTVTPLLPEAVQGNVWQQWVHASTGLDDSRVVTPGAGQMPFPDPLLALLPAHTGYSPGYRASRAALWMGAAAVLVAMVSSAWHNHLLVRQVSDDLRRFQVLDPLDTPRRDAAIVPLRLHAGRLDEHYREGTPWSLALGLYRGAPWRAPLHGVIAAHDTPAPAEGNALPVRLDSLSLFSTGSAELKPASTKVLITALAGIKAQPGWLIVIAGHTDSSGPAERNVLLSRARAAAVRDWMQGMGDIPDSCFAVQGFGATQPLASNETEIGRAANRRVDIRLVPEAGACGLHAQVKGGQQNVAERDVQ